MQILGKRSKILLIAVAIAMLAALGLSFALWDTQAVKASSGNLSTYANAKVGDIIEFGQYYQTLEKDSDGEFIKTPIKWIVVDKDERTGQLTLMSKYILAAGSYFGNYYNNAAGSWSAHYDINALLSGIAYNQAYVDSTARAFLNNLERLDLGGDGFTSGIGYVPSKKISTTTTGLYSSVGFSNKAYWTGLYTSTAADNALVTADNNGLMQRHTTTDIYYQRPIKNDEYKNRPATRGFFDEAFTTQEKSMIAPKQIAGYTGYRWPDNAHDVSTKSYVEGAYDKVWLPSATELNIMNGKDKNSQSLDSWTNPSDEVGSTVFEYFKNPTKYGNKDVATAIAAGRTKLAENSFAMNYSIPVYNRLAANATKLTVNTDIHKSTNSSNYYWTRSPMSYWFHHVRIVNDSGLFDEWYTYASSVGIRPFVILKY